MWAYVCAGVHVWKLSNIAFIFHLFWNCFFLPSPCNFLIIFSSILLKQSLTIFVLLFLLSSIRQPLPLAGFLQQSLPQTQKNPFVPQENFSQLTPRPVNTLQGSSFLIMRLWVLRVTWPLFSIDSTFFLTFNPAPTFWWWRKLGCGGIGDFPLVPAALCTRMWAHSVLALR